jgi:hypothetical protein
VRFQQSIINELAEKYDQTAVQLEQTSRSSAWTRFRLNLMSAGLSLLGFEALWYGGSAKPKPLVEADKGIPFESPAAQPLFPEPDRLGGERSSSQGHHGSFPDGEYGR